MSAKIQPDQFRFIPVGRLSLSPLNVRKTGAESGIEELAALIHSQGVLQNLTVYEECKSARQRTNSYAVIAGGRRWRALQLLVKQKRIPPTCEVPCLVTTYERAVEISLAENSGHEGMHPADQFEAFKALIDAGQSVEKVAARFGVSPLVVQRRLKLANVAPDFIRLYRENEITLQHLMVFALTDDQAKQRQVWDSLREHERHPSALRRLLTENEISVREPIVRFVGLTAYEKAGGAIRRDLFSDEDDGFILDADLLKQLATAKLEKQAAQVKADGAAWVEITPRLDYAELAQYGRVKRILREPTEEEQTKIDAVANRLAEIEGQAQAVQHDEDRLAELADRAEELDAELDELREQRMIPHPGETAVAGAVVSIGHDGKARIERGLLRADDAKRCAAGQQDDEPAESPSAPRLHSASLVRRLTAHRTRALQATLAQQPTVALAALTHRLVLATFFRHGVCDTSALQIVTTETPLRSYAADLHESPAERALDAQRDAWRAKLPEDVRTLLPWLLQQSAADVLALLAYCVALSVNGVQSQEGPHALDVLAQATQLDMRDWWTPTAQAYLGRLPKARILEVVREAVSAEVAASLAKMKKGALATVAEQRLFGTGWLPTVLRGVRA